MDGIFSSGWKIIHVFTARFVLIHNPVYNEMDDGKLAVAETFMHLLRIVRSFTL